MNIHAHFFCYNEERILPFFMKHYSKICTKIFITDQSSTDSSVSIIKSYPNTEVINNNYPENDDAILADMKNNQWKMSRGLCDYVIVGDIDEFIYAPNGRLEQLHDSGYTVIKPVGYDMISTTYPKYDRPITETVKKGRQSGLYSKCMVFDPNKITEINYDYGAHLCHPTGDVRFYESNGDVKLLHYKYLSLEKCYCG